MGFVGFVYITYPVSLNGLKHFNDVKAERDKNQRCDMFQDAGGVLTLDVYGQHMLPGIHRAAFDDQLKLKCTVRVPIHCDHLCMGVFCRKFPQFIQ